VFIILDSQEEKSSIMNMKTAEAVFNSKGEMDYDIKSYMEDFPFKYYTIVNDVEHLPNTVGAIFLQWLAMINH
jgi:midasin